MVNLNNLNCFSCKILHNVTEHGSIVDLPTHVYTVMCRGGATLVNKDTHNGCALPADLASHRPSMTSFRSDLLIYHNVHSGGENFVMMEISGLYLLYILLVRD